MKKISNLFNFYNSKEEKRLSLAIIAGFILLVAISFSFSAETVYGGGFLDRAGDKLGEAGNAAGVSEEEEDLGTLIGSAIRVVLQLVGVIFLVLMVYAGFLWMTSRGQEDKVERARNIITTTVVGMFIVITAYAITVLITGTIG